MTSAFPIPLSGWADAQIKAIAAITGFPPLAALSGATLLGERAALNGFVVPGTTSAGGGCRFFATSDGHISLNLSRDDDRAMLPALLGDASVDPNDVAALEQRMSVRRAEELAMQGRTLGLAIASLNERPVSPPCRISATGLPVTRREHPPLVVDLTALWAGPLAGHLLGLSGARVIKVESRNRPDRMRQGDPALFARLNQQKANVALDLRDRQDRDALISLIRRADFVLEAARPRALPQLGINPDALVRDVPGLVWVTITGHGDEGEAGNWIGFGDDCSVAAGLSAALLDASGRIGFGGDACADPLAGIHAARCALEQRASGIGARMILSMSAIVAKALADERAHDEDALMNSLKHWVAMRGQPFPAVADRSNGSVASLGQDNEKWLAATAQC
ncbi:CoA transferase [Sphingobium sp. H39-3-25]|uniref:CoA transferase n=1 Tax=Sphingobium arseniciresistens TaxID=3030834 RepID=UPI0023BA053E|nr:CoA transferase [Sphingobium arseniciresistens]